ncbi:MAG: cyclopropane-fatty-acyl-phospholipid synthase family protein [Chromatiales bacterium]|jgi:cyclopropane-fatty-acyl-phospholipid synthase
MAFEEIRSQTINPVGPFVARPVLNTLERLHRGQLTVVLPQGQRHVFTGDQAGPVATMYLRRPLSLTARLLARGSIGLAEGYMAGDWRAPELTDVLHVLALNEPELGALPEGRRAARLIDRLHHIAHRNSLRGSRRNIAYHYDLGNDFYRLWLDESMTYSAALFSRPDEPLSEAQDNKYRRIIERLGARAGDHILEIGCGWGGFASYAARQGLRVTGITLSREQLDFARARMRDEGLEDRVELRLQDYRQLDQRFDHVVSIEMFEAVGEEYWPQYFETVYDCLRPGGRASLQVITIDADRFESYRQGTDFIQKYIFPGGMLPSVEVFEQHAGAAGLAMRERDMYGADYAHTLKLWDQRVLAASRDIEAMGFDERFLRMWRYYLAYCETGFKMGRIDLMQAALERPAE